MDFKYKKKYKAETGQAGMKRNKFGKKGENLIIKVPVGTILSDSLTGRFLCDLDVDGIEFTAAIGGKGGLGNSNFKNSIRQAPNFAEAGAEGTERTVKLELKLIADVGLVGFPNVGKSTLLSVASAAKPKIADYHFTTLVPNLGVVSLPNTDFVIADLPGLIEGAAEGAGLGIDFLRHIERTKMIIHLVDASGSEGRDPLEDFVAINKELEQYSPRLIEKPTLVALSKMDITDKDSESFSRFIAYLDNEGLSYFEISAVTNSGVRELLNAAAGMLAEIEAAYTDEDLKLLYGTRLEVIPLNQEEDYRDINIEINEDGEFVLSGKQLKKIFDSTNFNDYESLRYLYKHLVKNKIINKMKKEGLEEGDTVHIYDYEFEYIDED
jgi:GTP-binding protein